MPVMSYFFFVSQPRSLPDPLRCKSPKHNHHPNPRGRYARAAFQAAHAVYCRPGRSVTLQGTRSFAACNQHRQSKAQWKPALQHRPYVDLYSLVRCFPAASGSLPKAFTEEQCPRLPSTTPHHCSKTGRATFPSILVFYPIISYRPNLQSISLPLHDSREIICGCSVSGSFPGGRYVSRPSIAALWRSLQSSRLRAHQLLPPSSSCLC